MFKFTSLFFLFIVRAKSLCGGLWERAKSYSPRWLEYRSDQYRSAYSLPGTDIKNRVGRGSNLWCSNTTQAQSRRFNQIESRALSKMIQQFQNGLNYYEEVSQ